VWVNIADFWRAMKFTFSPDNGLAWFQGRKARWQKLAILFELGDNAVRASLPYDKLAKDSRV
jgi:hypothetical protein